MSQVTFSPMECPATGKQVEQRVLKQTEDGVTLLCLGCGKTHSHEIGFFAPALGTNRATEGTA